MEGIYFDDFVRFNRMFMFIVCPINLLFCQIWTIFNKNAHTFTFERSIIEINEREKIQDLFIDTSSDIIFHSEISNGDL